MYQFITHIFLIECDRKHFIFQKSKVASIDVIEDDDDEFYLSADVVYGPTDENDYRLQGTQQVPYSGLPTSFGE